MKFIVILSAVAIIACNGFVHSFGMEHKGLKLRGGMSMVAGDIPELRAPKSMYENAVAAGATKASNPPLKTFILGILSGCHIAFGGFMLLAVGGACPGLAATNPGLQKLVAGAFGLPFGNYLQICLILDISHSDKMSDIDARLIAALSRKVLFLYIYSSMKLIKILN